MDFIKQNLVIVASLAAVVLFMILGVWVLMMAGSNQEQEQVYAEQVEKAETYAGRALEAFGLVQSKENHYALVDDQRQREVLRSLSSLVSQLRGGTGVSDAALRWARDVFAEDRQTAERVAENLAAALEDVARRQNVSPAEAVEILRGQVRSQTRQLVDWEVPSGPGAEPQRLQLNVGCTRQLVGKIADTQDELSTMLEEVIAEQVQRAGINQVQLVPNLFPRAESRDLLVYQDEYRKRIDQFSKDLMAGRPYTAQELADLVRPDGGQRAQPIQDLKPPNPFPGLVAEVPIERGRETGPMRWTPSLATVTTAQAMTDQEQRQLAKARSTEMQMYLVDPEQTFDVPEWGRRLTERVPTLVEAWDGQIKLWIMQDVAAAVGKTNLDTPLLRETLTGNAFSVQQAIVKHLKSVRIGGDPRAVLAALGGETTGLAGMGIGMAAGGASALGDNPYRMTQPGAAAGAGRTAPTPTFTRRGPCPFYDVTYVGIRLIIEDTQIRRLMKYIDQQRFYTAIQVVVRDVDQRAARTSGFWYGPQPMVDLILVYEALLFRQAYERPEDNVNLIPEAVKQRFAEAGLSWQLPQPPEK